MLRYKSSLKSCKTLLSIIRTFELDMMKVNFCIIASNINNTMEPPCVLNQKGFELSSGETWWFVWWCYAMLLFNITESSCSWHNRVPLCFDEKISTSTWNVYGQNLIVYLCVVRESRKQCNIRSLRMWQHSEMWDPLDVVKSTIIEWQPS